MARLLAESSGFAQAAPRMLEVFEEHLGWPVSVLWLAEEEALRCFELHCAIDAPDFLKATRQRTFRSGEGLPGRAWLSGLPVWVDDLSRKHWFVRAAEARRAGLKCGCAFPILVGEEVLGVIELYGRRTRRPDAELLALLADMGHLIGQFIARERAQDALARRAREMEALYEISRDVTAQPALGSLLELVLNRAVALVGGAGGGIALDDPASHELVVTVARGLAPPAGTRLARTEGIAGQVLDGRKAVALEDYSSDPRRSPRFDALNVGALAVAPLVFQGTPIGVLGVTARRDEAHRFSESDLRLLHLFATQVAAAVHDAQAREALRESEERYRSVVEALDEGIVVMGPGGSVVAFNQSARRILGLDEAELLGASSLDRRWSTVHEDGSPFPGATHPSMATLSTGEPRTGVIMGFDRPDGERIWISVNSRPLFASSEEARALRPSGVVVSFSDVTKRHRAEQALRESEQGMRRLSARLLKLQDEERRRIARELHDSTGQSLAALGMNLALVARAAPALEPGARRALEACLDLAEQASREIRTTAYLLHPPLLDEAGLASAVRWFCEGLQAKSGLQIELDVPKELPRAGRHVETAAFRIVQEALTNVHRHSTSARAQVRVGTYDGLLLVEVSDSGVGMPADVLKKLRTRAGVLGVGIAGMRERVRQLRGSLKIDSGPGGTCVRALLPLHS